MRPVIFEAGSFSMYSYGLLIAFGAIGGVIYMYRQGKEELGLTFDKANSLFLYIFFAALIGGKVFLFFENPGFYLDNPRKLIQGAGFVFYGSFLFAVPTMLWFFKRNRLDTLRMLDIMAVTTCIVHFAGRIGCFMAGCCHGSPTDSWFGVSFSDPMCHADPKNIPLHPTQLYEAGTIVLIMIFLLNLRRHRSFHGQVFFSYLVLYAVSRFFIEYFRGDSERGSLFDNVLSHSQLIAVLVMFVSLCFYYRYSKKVERQTT